MPDVFAELEWRGFVHQATPDVQAHLAGGRRTVYCGFDPTAPSLQLGNLMPIMLLRHLQLGGHRPDRADGRRHRDDRRPERQEE